MTEPLENPTPPITGTEKTAPVSLPPYTEQEISQQTQPTTRTFEPLMQQPVSTETSSEMPSPMQLAAGEEKKGEESEVTAESLHDGLDRLNDKVGSLKEELTPNRFSEMSDAQKALLKTKLGQFGQSVQGLSHRLGVNYSVPQPKGLLSDVRTVLDWLTHGQAQLSDIGDQLAKKGKGTISVVSMLRAQAQLLAAERAINFATAIVSKGSDFISKIMQTQL